LIRTARERYEKRIAQKEDDVARRESAIAAQRAELARAVDAIEQQVTSRLKIEREIAAEEAKQAQLSELESKIDQVAHLQQELHERDNKLAEAQKAQAESEDALKLNTVDKEEQIASMQRQLEDLELIYQYLTGPRFRQRIEAIVEKFSIMQTDLERERKTMTRLRARREGQIRGVIESTVGMYGDFQGIAGKALGEIDGLAQIARRVEARRKRGPTNHRVEPISARGRTH
jgi:chromosome segregation ATPase